MKVLHIIDSLGVGGGAEHSLTDLLPLLDERGIDSSIAVTIARVGGLQQSLEDKGYPLTVLRGWSWLGRAWSLRRLVQATSPDVVHATLYYSCLTARLARIGGSSPLLNSRVSTSYDPARTRDNATSPWKLAAIRRMDRITGRSLVDHFHVVTEEVRRETTDVLGIPDERISVIPRGRSARKLGEFSSSRRESVRARLGLAACTPVLLNVGRQDHAKDHLTLVRAFALVLRKYPDAVLLLAGREGDATHMLDDALAELSLGDSVRLMGHREDVANLYVAADLMVFPSLYEGAAGAVLEAMALRLPVVGSEAVSDVLRGGALGPVVAKGDVPGLAQAVAELLGDADARQRLAEASHLEFTEHYDIETVADQTAQLYAKMQREGSLRRRRR